MIRLVPQTFKRGGAFPRWAGSIADIVSIFRLAAGFVSTIAQRDMTENMRIHVDSQVFEDRFETLAEFEQAIGGDTDLELIQGISANVGVGYPGGSNVLVIFQRQHGPAAVYGVGGADRTWVEGAAAQLEEAMRKQAQAFRWERWLKSDRALLVASLTAGLLLNLSIITVASHGTIRNVLVGFGLIVIGALLLYLLLVFAMRRSFMRSRIVSLASCQSLWRSFMAAGCGRRWRGRAQRR